MLKIKDLTRHYGYVRILDHISLDISSGELVLLLGPNGAGKTSLIQTLISRNPPETGTILYQNRSLKDYLHRRNYLASIGYIGHDPGLFLDMTAAENLKFFHGLHFTKKPDTKRIMDLLELVGLADRADDLARIFSRGMRQRLGLARTILHNPDILIMDEPLTGLDRKGEDVLALILKMHKGNGKTSIIVTHSEEPFRHIATRYVFLKNGKIIADINSNRYNEKSRETVHNLLYS